MQDLSVDEWVVAASERFSTADFFERGAILHQDRTPCLAFVSSAYESCSAPGERPFERGLNHFSFVLDSGRWLITQTAWELETPEHPLSSVARASLQGLPPALADVDRGPT